VKWHSQFSIKAVSFDADGTLLGTFTDRPHGFAHFFLEAAKDCGISFSLEKLKPILKEVREEEMLRRQKGFRPYISSENARLHWLWYYEQVFKKMGCPEPQKMAEEFLRRYEQGEFTTPYSDVMPCLEVLASKKIPMILISNYSACLLQFLEKWNLKNFFQAILISGIEGIEKSNPLLFQKGAHWLSLKPSEILHVGNDPVEDYEASINAGFQALLLDRDNVYTNLQLPSISSLVELPSKICCE
jgi:HAD superfamily hydrolase (TIGR01549 family)